MVIHHLGEIAGGNQWPADPGNQKEIRVTGAVEFFDWPDGPITRASGLVERVDKRVGN
jgi:hypothetical protein